MDIDTGTFQANFLGSAYLGFAAVQGVNNGSLSGGLTRYHSAPSSVLAGLLDDDLFSANEESEFARLLSDGMGPFSPPLDTRVVQQGGMKEQGGLVSYGNGNAQSPRVFMECDSNFPEALSQNPLSSISECALEVSAEEFGIPLLSGAVTQPGHVNVSSFKPSSCVAELQRATFPSSSIKQSSSPAEALSRLFMEENSDALKLGCVLVGPHSSVKEAKLVGQSIVPTSQQVTTANSPSDVNCSDRINSISAPRRSNVLLRHSSSPAGLLSQINLEDFPIVKDKRLSQGISEMCSVGALQDRKGLISGGGHSQATGNDTLAGQAMQHFIDLGQRKRGRGSEGNLPKGLQRGPNDLGTVTSSCFSPSPPSSSSPASIDCTDGATEESVLCKARAKRGCATHPRSIAERQRRLKISERMKKLQDLVPNLDKQASTAEMLDEVVDYVKLLQRQVQELSLNCPTCTGSCQQLRGGSP